MSPADSVIIFILAIVIIYVVLFVATLNRRSARDRARAKNSMLVDASPTPVNADDAAIAKRLNSSAPNARARDSHSVDIGGNY
ncbi:MAG TPA: hypothetical protein VL485_11460 [Ktedonobacteraceae bacterium]|nr:hypothetical protein [Ktedonobacteraceae bacterium]